MIGESRTSITRYGHGVRALFHKGRNITTSVGSQIDAVSENITDVQTKIGRVPAGFEHRPDLISNVFFGTPGYWWYLMLVNGVTDPFEGFNSGDQILIPVIS
tara:strand:- start:3921 stop:4226 length:306 start_codon:yes stop_codon:yes gene_type:complete